MTGSSLIYKESSGAFRRRCRFMASWGRFLACGLISLSLHVALLGSLLLTIALPTRPAGQAGSGQLIAHLIQEGTRQGQVAMQQATEPSPKTLAPKSVAPPANLNNQTPSMFIAVAPSPVTSDRAASVVGLGLPTGTSFPVSGQRRLFSPPTAHQGSSGASFSSDQLQDEQLQWEQRRQAAQQAFLRRQVVEQYLRQWIVQLRSVLPQIEKLSCQLIEEEVTCDPVLPPDIQATVEQGFRQLQALDPWQPLHRLVIVDGAFRFNPEPVDAVSNPATVP